MFSQPHLLQHLATETLTSLLQYIVFYASMSAELLEPSKPKSAPVELIGTCMCNSCCNCRQCLCCTDEAGHARKTSQQVQGEDPFNRSGFHDMHIAHVFTMHTVSIEEHVWPCIEIDSCIVHCPAYIHDQLGCVPAIHHQVYQSEKGMLQPVPD